MPMLRDEDLAGSQCLTALPKVLKVCGVVIVSEESTKLSSGFSSLAVPSYRCTPSAVPDGILSTVLTFHALLGSRQKI
jgi:hypothetical protein